MYEKKPWLQFYGATPATLSYPELSMYGAYHRMAPTVASVPALVFMGRRMTHAELDRRICAISRGLAAEGLRAGDHVLGACPMCPRR